MRTLTPSGASFAKAAAQAVVGETPAEAVCEATAAAAKATPVVAKAEAKHWKREKEWKCYKCRNVCSKVTTTCISCEFDNLTIVECKARFRGNKQPAIAEMCEVQNPTQRQCHVDSRDQSRGGPVRAWGNTRTGTRRASKPSREARGKA